MFPRCMEYTAFNQNAWNPLHSIGMLWAMLHTIYCIQSGCLGPHCMDSTAYNRDPLHHNAWNPLHSIRMHVPTLHGVHCIHHAAWTPLHTIGIHCATMHGILCIQ